MRRSYEKVTVMRRVTKEEGKGLLRAAGFN
jgi:hypothetical protein